MAEAADDEKVERPNFTSSDEDDGEGQTSPRSKKMRRKTGKETDAKIGHRRVDRETGEVQYKKVKSSTLMQSIQMGIRQSVGSVMQRPARDLLLKDFEEEERITYPKEGSGQTPPHHFEDFSFTSYAPVAFRHFREAFDIDTADFLLSLCDRPLRELSNPGASGSVFYLSHDDVFIIKTVQTNEHHFLRKLLPGYYMNMVQNKRTLLPKFFGLFCYQTSLGRKIRFVVMNNILPSRLTYYEKYDLKGSTFGRLASENELKKKSPTLKDLDFTERHAQGLRLPKETYDRLASTLRRDCTVLESFKIMDYSLLLGLHNVQRDVDAGRETASPELVSAHQATRATLSVPAAAAAATAGAGTAIAESPLATPQSREASLTIAGATGYGSLINGTYDATPDTLNGKTVYRLRDGVPQGHGRLSGTNLYLVFSSSQSRWEIGSGPSPADSCFAYLGGGIPVSDATHVWSISDGVGHFKPEPACVSTLGFPLATSARSRRMSFTGPQESIEAEDSRSRRTPAPSDEALGGLLAYNEKGEKLYVFVGVIDVLQSYVLKKRLEHTWKAMIHDGDTVSVHRPSFYVKRFIDFMLKRIFVPCDDKGMILSTDNGEQRPAFVLARPINSSSFRRRRGDSPSHESRAPTTPRILTEDSSENERDGDAPNSARPAAESLETSHVHFTFDDSPPRRALALQPGEPEPVTRPTAVTAVAVAVAAAASQSAAPSAASAAAPPTVIVTSTAVAASTAIAAVPVSSASTTSALTTAPAVSAAPAAIATTSPMTISIAPAPGCGDDDDTAFEASAYEV